MQFWKLDKVVNMSFSTAVHLNHSSSPKKERNIKKLKLSQGLIWEVDLLLAFDQKKKKKDLLLASTEFKHFAFSRPVN